MAVEHRTADGINVQDVESRLRDWVGCFPKTEDGGLLNSNLLRITRRSQTAVQCLRTPSQTGFSDSIGEITEAQNV